MTNGGLDTEEEEDAEMQPTTSGSGPRSDSDSDGSSSDGSDSDSSGSDSSDSDESADGADINSSQPPDVAPPTPKEVKENDFLLLQFPADKGRKLGYVGRVMSIGDDDNVQVQCLRKKPNHALWFYPLKDDISWVPKSWIYGRFDQTEERRGFFTCSNWDNLKKAKVVEFR